MANINITKIGQRTVSLPSFEGAEIALKTTLTVAEVDQFQESVPENSKNYDEELGNLIIVNSILSWNLSDDDGVLPITLKSLKLLPIKDFQFLVQEITGNKKLDEKGEILSPEKQKSAALKKQ